MSTVKRPDKRAERSRRTREKVIQAARELFVAQGYGATSLQEVADRAGVAVQTVYFVFGNKRALFKEVVDTSIVGDIEPVAVMDREWFRAACAEPTAAGQVRAHVRGTSEILGRVAPLMPMIESARAADPQIAAQWPDGPHPRYVVQRAAAEALAGKPGARPGLSVETAADLLFCLLSPDLYLLFVQDRGWSQDQWEEWAGATLTAQLCADPATGTASVTGAASAAGTGPAANIGPVTGAASATDTGPATGTGPAAGATSDTGTAADTDVGPATGAGPAARLL